MKIFLNYDSNSVVQFEKLSSQRPELVFLSHYFYSGIDCSTYIHNLSSDQNVNIKDFVDFSTTWNFSDGKDNSIVNNFSWGPVISCSLLFLAPYVFKEYQALKSVGEIDELWISNSELNEFKLICRLLLKDKVNFYDPNDQKREIINNLYIRRSLPPPPNDIRLKLLEALQVFTFRKVDSLSINEGSLISFLEKKPELRILNSRKLDKSFYCNFSQKYRSIANSFIPVWLLDESFYIKEFKNSEIFKNSLINEPYINLLSSLLVDHLKNLLPQIVDWLAYYLKLFEKSKLRNFYFPGERVEFYTVGICLANSMNIQTTYMHDGFCPVNKMFYFYQKDGVHSLFDNLVLFKNDDLDFLSDPPVAPQNKFISKDVHPMLNKAILKKENDVIHDVIIFIPISIEYNPYCFPDKIPFIMRNLCLELLKLNLNVAIKFKGEKIKKLCFDFYKDLEGVSIYSSETSTSCISKSRLLITGTSTAIWEAQVLHTECIIFEPKENGFDTETYANSFIKKHGVLTEIEQVITAVKSKLLL